MYRPSGPMTAVSFIILPLWANHVLLKAYPSGGVTATGQGNRSKKNELERAQKREGGTDKAVFNERGMCILRIFMTI